MQSLNILLIHNHYRIPGGEDTVVENEKKMLEDHGHKVILYTRSNREIKDKGILSKVCLLFVTLFSIRSYGEVRRIIKENKIDLVHVHNTLSLISPSVYYAALRCKVPVVQTIHNFRLICPGALLYRKEAVCEECLKGGLRVAVRHQCYRNSRLQTAISAFTLWLHRQTGIYKKIYYICLTEFNKKKLLEENKGKRRVFLPENIYIKPNFTADAEYRRKKRKDQFVYLGRLEEEKGVKLLLEAWRQIPESQLLVCGIGSLEQWCQSFIEKHQMKNVKLPGYLTKEQMQIMLGESKALIFPSKWYEGFPMTILESFRAGTPVIANDVGNGAGAIEKGVNGVIFGKDSVEDLIHVVTCWQEGMEEGARRTFEEKYSPEKNYALLMEIYREILKIHGRI